MSFNGDVYFAAHNGTSPQQNQLWESNGTVAGTQRVASFSPASTPGSFVTNTSITLGSYVIFIADDGLDGDAVWSSNGTTSGTVLLAAGDPQQFVSFTNSQGNDEVYFVTFSPTPALWETNGTVAGTSIVKQLPSSSYSYYYNITSQLTVVGNQLFFISSDGNNGEDLWVSNGTTAGTSVVKDIVGHNTSYGNYYYSLNVQYMTAAAGKLFFMADDPNGGIDLWVSNGTTAGTTVLMDFNPSTSYMPPISNLTAANGALYFSGNTGSDGAQPWVSNGTTSGTVMLADVNSANGGSYPSDFVALGNKVYFFMTESGSTVGLWKSGGTAASTSKVFDGFPTQTYNSTSYTAQLASLTASGSNLYFTIDYELSGCLHRALDK